MRVGDSTETIRREIDKATGVPVEYGVHIRTDPSDQTKARYIRGFVTKCKQEELHKRIAALEAYFLLADPSATYRTINIEDGHQEGWLDERSTLPEEDRRKVNEDLPKMIAKGESEVEKIAKSYFDMNAGTQYIG